MTVPLEILHKPGKLTPAEFQIIKSHTTTAYDMLKFSKRKFIQAAAVIALQHHEKWDGSGYPNRLAGENHPHLRPNRQCRRRFRCLDP